MKRLIRQDGFCFKDSFGKELLSVNEQFTDNLCTVTLNGSINDDLAYEVSDELLALLSVGKDIVLDIEKLAYLSDTFSEKLVRLEAHMEELRGGSVQIRSMSRQIFEALRRNHCISSLDYELKEE